MGLVATLVFASCNEGKKAPQDVQNAIEKMYPGISKVDWENKENASWEAEFKNNGIETSALFSTDGKLLRLEEEIAYSLFPKLAKDYITKNFPGANVKEISKITDKNKNVTFQAEVKDKNLIFDTLGNFLQTNNNDENSLPANSAPVSESGKVEISELPQSVHDFVAKNYVGYTIKEANHDPMCTGEDAIDVAISKARSTTYSLIFTPQGKFIQQEEDVDIKTAPSKITEVIKANFADYTISHQIEKLTLVNKSIQYMVDLSKAGAEKEVIFDLNGNVICEH